MKGFLRMMEHEGLNPVTYYLVLAVYNPSTKKTQKAETKEIRSDFTVNSLLGKKLKLTFTEEIRCVDCGRMTKKSFNQGSCYSCFMNLASNDFCIMKPETCHHHLGTCREPEWGLQNCFKKHTLYLANTSGVKVGITKENPVTKRWVDQGAMFAIPVLEFSSRRDSGIVENELAKYVADKTSWQKMISSDSIELDLFQKKEELLSKIQLKELVEDYKELKPKEITTIKYPILNYPTKKVSYKPDKAKPIEDKLVGVKGQYLLFEKGVINLRSYGGYYVELEVL
ncbi:MAG: DUF2797 domain-containing protein [Leptospiraceae bacterium]|nr:DUF2797 domain-containing protein [Leptospiraceae bacterium]